MAGQLEQTWVALKQCFSANEGPLTKAQAVAWIKSQPGFEDINPNTIGSQLYRSCANLASMQKYATPKILIHDRRSHTYRLATAQDELQTFGVSKPEEELEEIDERIESTFVLEAHLRDFLARNLSILEKGLTLWSDNPPSVEYSVGTRRIDILARDIEGTPVVIELKVSKSYDRVIGQALLYQGLLAKQLKSSGVRIMLVAGEVSDELKVACSRQNDVKLFEYSIQMQTKEVSSADLEGEE
jgi:RecB family endonuclease NucS